MQSRGGKLAIYLERNRLDFYVPGSDVAQSLQLPLSALSDLEVVDKPQLATVIGSFLKARGFEESRVLIILAPSVVFEKILPPNQNNNLDHLIRKFLSKVPFDQVMSRSLPQDGGHKVFAFNEDFADSLKSIFEDNGCVVEGFIPATQIDSQVAVSNVFTIAHAQAAFQKFNTLKETGFIQQQTKSSGDVNFFSVTATVPTGRSRQRLFALISFFLALVVILVVLLLRR